MMRLNHGMFCDVLAPQIATLLHVAQLGPPFRQLPFAGPLLQPPK